MLRYLGAGKRPFGDYPMPVHPRINWEFQAVIQGKVAPITRGHQELMSTTLWLFPPGQPHGWQGEPGRTSEVVVFHYSSVPESIEQLASKYGYLKARLRRPDLARIRRWAKLLSRHYWRPMLASDIHADRVLLDLCVLLIREYPDARLPRQLGASYSRVAAAEDWLRVNLARSPKVEDAARAVGVSVSQLDRLFAKIRGESPGKVLVRLKIERAMQLLGDYRLKLENVAAQSGFSSASNLCRAFKAAKGSSPTDWRDETLIRYRTPRGGHGEDYTAHGHRDRRGL